MTTPYLEELAGRLRDCGVPEDEVAGTVDDLAAYAAESGADPGDEFGTPAEFAARLVSSEAESLPEPVPEPVPESSDETWRWTADAFQDRRMLNRFGDEGWEVERVDSLGRFVSRRDPESEERWEYRRESVLPGRRDAVAGRLAPDGWEPCGSWLYYEYFKRPKAGGHAPGADPRIPPRGPAKRLFWSRHFYVFIACYFGFWVAVCTVWIALAPAESRSRFLVGALVGLVVAAVAAGIGIRRGSRRSR